MSTVGVVACPGTARTREPRGAGRQIATPSTDRAQVDFGVLEDRRRQPFWPLRPASCAAASSR